MLSFSDVAFVLLCFVMFCFVLFCFVQSFFSFFDMHAPRQPHAVSYLTTLCVLFRFCFFLFCFFGDVAFSDCFCTITVFPLYGEHVVHFFLPDGVFLPCDHGLDFLH